MNRLLKLFLLQTIVVAVVAVPVYFYLRSDYREFQVKKQIASQVPDGIGAVCGDGWYSGSTGRGTCSHHGGVKYWGAELQRIIYANWIGENSLFFFVLTAGLIGWYAYGARSVHRRQSNANQISNSNQLQGQCCTGSLAEGLRFCSVCGAVLTADAANHIAVSPAMTYVLMTATALLTVGLTIMGVLYFRTRQAARLAAAAPVAAISPSVSSTPLPSPTFTPTPKPTPTATPDDDLNLDSGLLVPDPLEEAVRSVKEKATPTPDPYLVPIREPTVNSPTPRPTIYTESLVHASDVLIAGYSRVEDSRTYRFHLSQKARIKGSFSAQGNISVYIVGGYYSSIGPISSDSIDVTMSAGTYEVIVSARQSASFSLHLSAYYDQ